MNGPIQRKHLTLMVNNAIRRRERLYAQIANSVGFPIFVGPFASREQADEYFASEAFVLVRGRHSIRKSEKHGNIFPASVYSEILQAGPEARTLIDLTAQRKPLFLEIAS